jgi:hypothetical protein
MNPDDWTAVGIQEAADKYAVNLPAYFEGRDNKGEVAPYVAPEKVVSVQEYVAPVSKVVGVLTGLVLLGKMFLVGIAAIFAWMEANQAYAVAGVLAVGAGVSVAAGIGKVGMGNNPGKPDSPTTGGNTYINNHYYQQGSGGQTNNNGA